jgi:uncharacterized membrane protein YGL010W
MKKLDDWLNEYGESHTNDLNEVIHYICVPAIVFSILGILWGINPWLAYALVIIAEIFYFRLSIKLALIMLAVSIIFLFIISWIPHIIIISVIIFAVSWFFQFVGHHYEGKKPSFLKDMQFLLIGPIWVLCKWFNWLPNQKS